MFKTIAFGSLLMASLAFAEPEHGVETPRGEAPPAKVEEAKGALIPRVAPVALHQANFRACLPGSERTPEAPEDDGQAPPPGPRTVDLNSVAIALSRIFDSKTPPESLRESLDAHIRQGFEAAAQEYVRNQKSAEQYVAKGNELNRVVAAFAKQYPLPADFFGERRGDPPAPEAQVGIGLGSLFHALATVRAERTRRQTALTEARARLDQLNAQFDAVNTKIAQQTGPAFELISQREELERQVEEQNEVVDERLETATVLESITQSRAHYREALASLPAEAAREVERWRAQHQRALDAVWAANEHRSRFKAVNGQATAEAESAAKTLADQLFAREVLLAMPQHPDIRPVMVFDPSGTLFHVGFYQFAGAGRLPPVVRVNIAAGSDMGELRRGRGLNALIARAGGATQATFTRFFNCPPLLSATTPLRQTEEQIAAAIEARGTALQNRR